MTTTQKVSSRKADRKLAAVAAKLELCAQMVEEARAELVAAGYSSDHVYATTHLLLSIFKAQENAKKA